MGSWEIKRGSAAVRHHVDMTGGRQRGQRSAGAVGPGPGFRLGPWAEEGRQGEGLPGKQSSARGQVYGFYVTWATGLSGSASGRRLPLGGPLQSSCILRRQHRCRNAEPFGGQLMRNRTNAPSGAARRIRRFLLVLASVTKCGFDCLKYVEQQSRDERQVLKRTRGPAASALPGRRPVAGGALA